MVRSRDAGRRRSRHRTGTGQSPPMAAKLPTTRSTSAALSRCSRSTSTAMSRHELRARAHGARVPKLHDHVTHIFQTHGRVRITTATPDAGLAGLDAGSGHSDREVLAAGTGRAGGPRPAPEDPRPRRVECARVEVMERPRA